MSYFTNLSGRQRLFFIVLLSIILTILVVLLTKGIVETMLVSLVLLIILIITKNIWLPENYGSAMVKRYSLYVILAVAIASMGNVSELVVNGIISNLLKNRFPELAMSLEKSWIDNAVVFIFVLAALYLINVLGRDNSVMGKHEGNIEKEFPEKDYKHHLHAFCGVLKDHLNKLDRETNWSAEYFTPLEAEVEVQTGKKKKRKITNLLKAIKSNSKNKLFLILGDPGAGKSVALRKLCRDLLNEVGRTGKVPVYINLKEWFVDREWTENHPPTVKELQEFVLENMKARGDVFSEEFLDRYFVRMLEDGRFFLVLDSFDEIPSVLDVESSWLIDMLSEVIFTFLNGSHASRGILSSRFFRRPTHYFQANSILEIRPFDEMRIRTTLSNFITNNEIIIKEMFKSRHELVSIARNPFMANLIASYIKDNDNILPMNQSELFLNYLDTRLKSCKAKMDKLQITAEEILKACVDISEQMFITKNFGLEAPIEELRTRLPFHKIDDVVMILKHARLGRLGAGDEGIFSFVHRRFNEYFLAQRLIEFPEKVTLEEIPNDSRGRDALVLYCELVSDEEAKRISEFCWAEISRIKNDSNIDMSSPNYLRAVHSMRFLNDAFRTRKECISSFQEELLFFINKQISSKNILSIKQAVEAVNLLEEQDIEGVILRAFEVDSDWVSETAFRSCRHMANISPRLERKISAYINSIDIIRFFRRRKETIFSLELSSGFKNILKVCKRRILDCYALIIALVFLLVIDPAILLTFVIQTSLMRLLFSYLGFGGLGNREILLMRIGMVGTLVVNYVLGISNFPVRTFMSPLILIPVSYTNQEIMFFVMTMLCFMLISPWFEMVFYFPVLKEHWSKIWKLAIKYIISLMILVSFLVIGKYYLNRVIMIVTVISIASLSVFYVLGNRVPKVYRDKKRLNKASLTMSLQREDISIRFREFETSWGRRKYVEGLEASKLMVKGFWEAGKLPNIDNDQASTMLARLEEKWLGLE